MGWGTRFTSTVSLLCLCSCSGPIPGEGPALLKGVLHDSGGAPRPLVFVQARNQDTGRATTVLTKGDGTFRIRLEGGRFQLLVGEEIDRWVRWAMLRVPTPPAELHVLGAGRETQVELRQDPRPRDWSMLSFAEYRRHLPERPGKEESLRVCSLCHGFRWQSLHPRPLLGWKGTLNWMKAEFPYMLAEGPFGHHLTPENESLIAAYLASLFGPDAQLPELPGADPSPISPEAARIRLVDFSLPTLRSFPWTAHPDPAGRVWIPGYNSNRLARLQPETGLIEEFALPGQERAALHSAVPGPDGSIWLAATATHELIRFDPGQGTFRSFRPPRRPGFALGQYPHTNVVDEEGLVWSSGGNQIVRFNPYREAFDFYGEAPLDWDSNGITLDRAGNVWYTRVNHHKIGRIRMAGGEVTEWDPPTPGGGPREIRVDAGGRVWFGEFHAGKLACFDPEQEVFREFPLPGPMPTPYALEIDAQGHIWYYSWGQSELGRLDPQTGAVIRFPVPYVDMTIREMFRDGRNRIWFAAPPINRVGYLVFPDADS